MARLFGDRTTTTVLASAARTTTGQSPAFDEGTLDVINVLLDVTAVSGTSPSLTVNIEWSNDGVKWFTSDPADTFAAITAASSVVKQFTVKGLYARLNYAITASVTFAAYSVVGS